MRLIYFSFLFSPLFWYPATLRAQVKEALRPIYYAQCVRSVCGDNWKSPATIIDQIQKTHEGKSCISEGGSNQLDAEGQRAKQEVLTNFKALLEAEKADFLHKVSYIETLPTKEEAALLTPEQKISITLALFISSMHRQLFVWDPQKHESMPNMEEIHQLAADLGHPLFSEILEIVSRGIFSSPVVRNMIELFTPEETQAYIENMYPNKTIDEVSHILYEKHTALRSSLLSHYPDLLLEEGFQQRLPASGLLELKKIIQEITMMEATGLVLKDGDLKQKISGFDFSALLQGYLQMVSPGDYISKFRELKTKIEENQKNYLVTLAEAFEKNHHFLPTEEQKSALKLQSYKNLKDIQGRIRGLFPKEEEFHMALQKIQIIFPPSKSEYVHRMNSEISYSIPSSVSKKSIVGKFMSFSMISDRLREIKTDDAQSIGIILSPKAVQILESYYDYSVLSDKEIPGPFIEVSLFTLSSDHGASVIAHEMGHKMDENRNLLQQKENQQKFREVEACLSTLHPEKPAETKEYDFLGETLFPGFYFSEDFADLISGKSYEKRKSVNIGCSLISSMEYTPLMNQSDTDSHSSHLYRILHSDVIKNGTVTPQCRSYLDNFEKNETAKRIQNCWK